MQGTGEAWAEGGVGHPSERKATCPRRFWLSEVTISIWFSTLAWTCRISTWSGGGERAPA